MQRVPPFVYSIFNERYKTGRDYRVPPLNFFFGTVRLFSIILSPKGPRFKFFDILQQTEISKSPKGLLFLVFRHYETVLKFSFFVISQKLFSKKFSNFFKCLQRVSFNFFDILQQTGFSKIRNGPPYNFRNFPLFEP